MVKIINLSKTRRTKALAVSIILSMTIIVSMLALPSASAHDPAWQIPTYANIHVSPDPVGVGQPVTVVYWLDKIYNGALIGNDYRFHNYEVVITRPDETTDKITTDTVWDTTSSQYTQYTPTQVGTYTFNFTFPGQNINDYPHATVTYNMYTGQASPNMYINDTYLPSTASTTLVVQEEPIESSIDSYPLPTEYWTRPIEGQNTVWYTISSNWLGFPHITANYQPDGIAPESAHIMWTKPISFGGVVGGTNTGTDGNTYYSGLSYETKFNPVIIMNGRMYYPLPKSNNGAGGFGATNYNGFVCVDLRTGEQLFWQNTTMPSFGQLLDYNDPNQHGVIPNGYLWQVSGTTWNALDPIDGNWLFSITNVPSGTNTYGPNGEILRYVLNSQGKWLAVWNTTKVIASDVAMQGWKPVGKVINSATIDGYSWNVSLPGLPAGSSIVQILNDDVLLGLSGTLPSETSSAPYTMFAISLKPESLGQKLWMKTYDPPTGNMTLALGAASWPAAVDPVNRVFCVTVKETFQWYGYSLDTGEKLWGPTTYNWDSFQYYGSASGGAIPLVSLGYPAYGKLFVPGYGGEIVAFDIKTGNVEWVYNNTYSGMNTVYGHYPIQIGSIADGKIYAHTSEHSPDAPPYKGAMIRCINATNGEEIWKISGWNTFTPYGANLIEPIYIADGYASFMNAYDMQIYTIGKGPSQTTVSAPDLAAQFGQSLVIKGTVTDIAAGTNQNEQAARFPNGVAAVSDESMSAWMEYVYMQKPKPTDVTGVSVELYALDANGNYRSIGVTTTDTNGFYSYQWTPDIPGKYTVYAEFSGSASYWPSQATTAFAVDPASATPTPTEAPLASMADLYLVPGIIGIIVAIIVVGAVIILVLRKRP